MCHTHRSIDAHIDENTHMHTNIHTKKQSPQSVFSAHNSSYLNKNSSSAYENVSLRAHASIVFGCRASSLFSVDIYIIYLYAKGRGDAHSLFPSVILKTHMDLFLF